MKILRPEPTGLARSQLISTLWRRGKNNQAVSDHPHCAKMTAPGRQGAYMSAPFHVRTHRIYPTPRRSPASTSHGIRHLTLPIWVHPQHSGTKAFPVYQRLGQSHIFRPIITAGKYLGEVPPHSGTRPGMFQFSVCRSKVTP